MNKILNAFLCIIVLFFVSCVDDCDLSSNCTFKYLSTSGDSLLLDVYFPQEISSPKPTIIYFHGGSWISGTRKKILQRYRAQVVKHLLEKEYVIISADYNLSGLKGGKMDFAVNDCKLVLNFVKQNSNKLYVDTSKIGFWGSSAGAHLVMMSVFTDSMVANSVNFIIDDFGPVDINLMFKKVPQNVRWYFSDKLFSLQQKDLMAFDSLTKSYSPINYSCDVPILIFHGTDDKVVNISYSESFCLQNQSNRQLVTFENNGHGLKKLDSSQISLYINSLDRFLEQIFGSSDISSDK